MTKKTTTIVMKKGKNWATKIHDHKHVRKVRRRKGIEAKYK
ncbi:hypothetical protein OIU84_002107 [Salix udensis]|uniref:Uncharacterized protein n=1 Tax=Salix udensis TaxID=889485 RepID=A0AAD6K8Y9_9ROSI|nr:hypothetical protein OIU84_002107 [Salix udensis]